MNLQLSILHFSLTFTWIFFSRLDLKCSNATWVFSSYGSLYLELQPGIGHAKLTHCLSTHLRLILSRPPFFGLSRQKRHWLQSSREQPSHLHDDFFCFFFRAFLSPAGLNLCALFIVWFSSCCLYFGDFEKNQIFWWQKSSKEETEKVVVQMWWLLSGRL